MIPNYKEYLALEEAAKYTTDKNHSLIAVHGLSLRDQIHIWHWQTEVGDQHKALGEFYENLLEKVDELVEVIMGKYGRISVKSVGSPKPLIDLQDLKNIDTFVDGYIKLFDNFRNTTFKNDTEIQNIIDEIVAETLKLKYLLTMS